MIDITAIVLTKNESKNIEDCIKSIFKFAKRILIVDSYSDDDTCSLAKSLGAEVHMNKFINYATQFNWALDNLSIKTKWVLRLDADERFTPELEKEIENLVLLNENTDTNGIVLDNFLFFMGKKLKYGASRKRKLMIFKYGIGRIEDRRMDEHTILLTGKSTTAKNRYLHYDFKNIDIFIKKLNWYATREMQDYIEYKSKTTIVNLHDKHIQKTRFRKFKIYYRFPLFFRSFLLFFYFYIIKLGFLDGKPGYIYNYLYTRFYRLLVDIKIYEQMRFNRVFTETGDLK
jgi:glycosyltransferase involved in cell wall biosynthesis